MQAGTLPLPVSALEERKRIQDAVKWEARGDGEEGGVCENVPLPRRVLQLFLMGSQGEEGSREEGWRKVEQDSECQIQRVSWGQGQRQWDVSPGTGTLGI